MSEQIKKLFDDDKLARELIETQTNTNFFVEASAGSGKTTALVNRMLALVRSGADVSRICAITFTRAAAKEFYHRFQRTLSGLSNDRNTPDAERELYRNALANIDLCFMGTIDAFCNMVLSEHPLEAAVPPDAAIQSDEEMTRVWTGEFFRVARGEYGDDMQKKYLRFCSVNYKPVNTFRKNIRLFWNRRNAELKYTSPDDIRCDDASLDADGKKSLLMQMIDEIIEHSDTMLYTGNGKVTKESIKRAKNFEALCRRRPELDRDWVENLPNVIYILKSIFGKVLLDKEQDGVFLKKYEVFLTADMGKSGPKMYKINVTGPDSPVTKLCEYQHAVSLDFFSRLTAMMAEKLRATGKFVFFDYLLYLRDTLKADAENGGRLIRHIYERHSYFLIDEFQDTNPVQAEVFFYLAAQNPDSDWRKCIPHPGSLFIVGDPKQSIYHFNGADVTSFLNVKKLFENDKVGRTLTLYRNFRSTQAMCSWFNARFAQMMPQETNTQSKYSDIPIDASQPEVCGNLNGVYRYPLMDLKNDPSVLSQIVLDLVLSGKYTVRDHDNNIHPVNYGDIMVITATKTRLHEYLKKFRENGIPVFIEGSTEFGNCLPLAAASQVIRAVVSNDPAMVYKALRGTAFGISEREFNRWYSQGRNLGLRGDTIEESSDCAALRDGLEQLRLLRRVSFGLPVSVLLDMTIERLKLFERCGSDNLEYLYFAAELLRSAETSGEIISLDEGSQFLDSLISESSPERCLSLKKNRDRVHMANLHKVKGLEAPIVILAKSAPSDHGVNCHVDYTQSPPEFYCFSLEDGSSTPADRSGKIEAEVKCRADENDRDLYVAATRARDALIISDLRKKDETPAANTWADFLDVDTPVIFPGDAVYDRDNTVSPDLAQIYKTAEKENLLRDRSCQAASFETLRPSQIKVKGRCSMEDALEDSSQTEQREHTRSDTSRHNAAVLGTMVHNLMEALVSSKGKTDTEAMARFLREEYGLSGETGDELLRIVADVGKRMCSGGYPQTNGLPADLLTELASAERVMCEVPFCLRQKEDGKASLTHGIMDLVYHKNGKWYIVDYKTSEDTGDLEKRYAEQLSAYRKAFLRLTGQEAEAHVYHIDA